MNEVFELETLLTAFVNEWESHGAPVKGFANLFFGRFIVFIADDTDSKICGRAIDGVARFVKEIETKFQLHLLDRLALAFYIKEKVEILPLSHLNYAIENGFVTKETLYFNNLVQTKQEFETRWIIPAGQSWLATKFSLEKA